MDVRKSLFFTLVALVVILALPVIAHAAPPNEVALKKALVKRGAIPKYASPQLAELYYQSYLARKSRGKSNDLPNPIAKRALEAAADAGGSGVPAGSTAAIDREPDANVLVLLVEFSDDDKMLGPQHNEIPNPRDPVTGDPTDNTSYWVSDFSPKHYADMLFNTVDENGNCLKSFTNYFLEQSGGTYMPSGEVHAEWVKLPRSEWWYGADKVYGDDNLNGPVWRIVQDAVAEAGDSINWADYDVDPKDGYVDHIQLIHAGAGQEAGGGAQGDSSIWSHSWACSRLNAR